MLLSIEHIGQEVETINGTFGSITTIFSTGRGEGHSFLDFVLKDYIGLFLFGFRGVFSFGFAIDRAFFGSGCTKCATIFFMIVDSVHL